MRIFAVGPLRFCTDGKMLGGVAFLGSIQPAWFGMEHAEQVAVAQLLWDPNFSTLAEGWNINQSLLLFGFQPFDVLNSKRNKH